MSMTRVADPGSKDERKLRRAIYFLWKAMGNNARADQAKTTPTGDLDYDFRRTMEKAWIVRGRKTGGCSGAEYVFTHGLMLHPKAFMRRNRLTVSGSPTIATNQGGKNVQTFHFGFDALGDKYSISPTSPGAGSYPFSAVSIPAIHWSDAAGRGVDPTSGSFANIKGILLDGANIMVTTQFTGCSCCFKGAANGVYATHLSPKEKGKPNLTDVTLAGQLLGRDPNVTGGDFANGGGGGPFFVYGRGASNVAGQPGGYSQDLWMMYVLGFRRTAGWKLYSQHVGPAGVAAVVRIFPP
jgi:hypothetical protein